MTSIWRRAAATVATLSLLFNNVSVDAVSCAPRLSLAPLLPDALLLPLEWATHPLLGYWDAGMAPYLQDALTRAADSFSFHHFVGSSPSWILTIPAVLFPLVAFQDPEIPEGRLFKPFREELTFMTEHINGGKRPSGTHWSLLLAKLGTLEESDDVTDAEYARCVQKVKALISERSTGELEKEVLVRLNELRRQPVLPSEKSEAVSPGPTFTSSSALLRYELDAAISPELRDPAKRLKLERLLLAIARKDEGGIQAIFSDSHLETIPHIFPTVTVEKLRVDDIVWGTLSPYSDRSPSIFRLIRLSIGEIGELHCWFKDLCSGNIQDVFYESYLETKNLRHLLAEKRRKALHLAASVDWSADNRSPFGEDYLEAVPSWKKSLERSTPSVVLGIKLFLEALSRGQEDVALSLLESPPIFSSLQQLARSSKGVPVVKSSDLFIARGLSSPFAGGFLESSTESELTFRPLGNELPYVLSSHRAEYEVAVLLSAAQFQALCEMNKRPLRSSIVERAGLAHRDIRVTPRLKAFFRQYFPKLPRKLQQPLANALASIGQGPRPGQAPELNYEGLWQWLFSRIEPLDFPATGSLVFWMTEKGIFLAKPLSTTSTGARILVCFKNPTGSPSVLVDPAQWNQLQPRLFLSKAAIEELDDLPLESLPEATPTPAPASHIREGIDAGTAEPDKESVSQPTKASVFFHLEGDLGVLSRKIRARLSLDAQWQDALNYMVLAIANANVVALTACMGEQFPGFRRALLERTLTLPIHDYSIGAQPGDILLLEFLGAAAVPVVFLADAGFHRFHVSPVGTTERDTYPLPEALSRSVHGLIYREELLSLRQAARMPIVEFPKDTVFEQIFRNRWEVPKEDRPNMAALLTELIAGDPQAAYKLISSSPRIPEYLSRHAREILHDDISHTLGDLLLWSKYPLKIGFHRERHPDRNVIELRSPEKRVVFLKDVNWLKKGPGALRILLDREEVKFIKACLQLTVDPFLLLGWALSFIGENARPHWLWLLTLILTPLMALRFEPKRNALSDFHSELARLFEALTSNRGSRTRAAA